MIMVNLAEISEALINGKAPVVIELVNKALAEGKSPQELLNGALIPGMDVVGKKFKANEFYVPEVLVAARAMQGGLNILKPLLAKAGVKQIGTVVIGTVKGDLHDIGKNLVSMMLEGADSRWLTWDRQSPTSLSAPKRRQRRSVIGTSVSVITTMPSMKSTVRPSWRLRIDQDDHRGCPVTQRYADEISAVP
jgi:5-methyltetrahydrofolate--homocysteine methyltransferase